MLRIRQILDGAQGAAALMRSRNRQGFGWQRWSKRWLYDELGLFKNYQVRRPSLTLKALPAR